LSFTNEDRATFLMDDLKNGIEDTVFRVTGRKFQVGETQMSERKK
jgi:hypothetical protein